MNARVKSKLRLPTDEQIREVAKLAGVTFDQARDAWIRTANAPRHDCGVPGCDCGDILNHGITDAGPFDWSPLP